MTEGVSQDPEEALASLRARVQSNPSDPEGWLALGHALDTRGMARDALQAYREGLAAIPGSPDLLYAEARALDHAGDRDAARERYQSLVARYPLAARPLASLLGLLRADATDELVDAAHALLRGTDLVDEDRAALGYALGKVHDARSEFDQAMASWQDANAARRRQAGGLDLGAFGKLLEDTRRRFEPELFDDAVGAAASAAGDELVFVVGMPRSGTTLVEQIMASHAEVHDCGELTAMPSIVGSLPARMLTTTLEAPRREALAARYLQASRRGAPVHASRRVDKQPLNFLYLGQVALLFPRARIVWCRRDLRDVAISIYGEDFSPESTYATDLREIMAFARIQEQLMAHWKQVLPNPFHEVEYERLVRDPEPAARSLVSFLGLDWDPACLAFHETARNVSTPSRWQVRQAIHARSIGRWANYSGWFPEEAA